MKTKNIKTFLVCCSVCCGITATTALTSCEDMLEMDSDRQIFDPALDAKTDSIYYIIGTLQGLQQVADQYVLVNELRGDLLAPTQYADSALTQLYSHNITASNPYGSAYGFYRVINNCNYYVAHRDTTLRTGSRQVALQEYAEALAIRAWCYLQLAQTYGRVPFYTQPLDNISEGDAITANTADYKDINDICDALAPELQKFVGTQVPDYGTINASAGKNVNSQRIMFPVDLVLADLYLEAGRYADAAQLYFGFLRDNQITLNNRKVTYSERQRRDGTFTEDLIPAELTAAGTQTGYDDYGTFSWAGSFNMNPASLAGGGDVITYIPLAVNKLQGTISNLPGMFGYNQFAANNDDETTYNEDYQLAFSTAYTRLADAQPYYYTTRDDVNLCDTLGDMRRWASLSALQNSLVNNGRYSIVSKLIYANVPVYRGTIVYLRLAECLNRMGYPDAAFTILKDGLGQMAYQVANYPKWNYTYETDPATGIAVIDSITGTPIIADSIRNRYAYITTESYELLTTTLPFLTQATRNIIGRAVGVHAFGCGKTAGTSTLYVYQDVLDAKAHELNSNYGLSLPDSILVDTEEGKKQAVEIVEDLICDEYALEAALEGHRYGDLLRLARHKNRGDGSGKPFGDDWGSRWLNGKLAFKQTSIDFSQQSNWFMPFR